MKLSTGHKTFAGKLSFLIAGLVLIIFAVIFCIASYWAKVEILSQANTITHDKVNYYASEITQDITNIETWVEAYETTLRLVLNDQESTYKMLEEMMKDERLKYAFVCLEPHQFLASDKGVMVEVIRDADGSLRRNQRDTTYHFRTYPYYLIPTRLHKNYWTTPYYAGGEKVCTFGHPLYDENGQLQGLLGVDLRLTILTEEIEQTDDATDAYMLNVISHDGHYIIHENKEYISNESVITDARMHNSEGLEAVGRSILAGQDSTLTIKYNGKKWLVSYTSIPSIGWGVFITTPYELVFEHVMEVVLYLLLLMILMAAVTIPIVRSIIRLRTKPIHLFSAAALRIAQGDFDTPIKQVDTGDEVQDLGVSLDHMRTSLRSYMTRLEETTAARQVIEKELSIANSIQMSMLARLFPTFSDPYNVEVYAFLQAAREVGGDLYDFVIRNHRLYFVIGDVSGKGLPASMFMAITISLFRAMLRTETSPEAIVSNINNTIAANNERNMFVTLIMGELNLNNGHLRFCNAGHDPMLKLGALGPSKVPMASNLPVGLMENFRYQLNEMDLLPSEKLLLYTDGVTEAENQQKELFTYERLLKVATDHSTVSAKQLVGSLVESVQEFVNDAAQSDDITIMAVHYNPKPLRDDQLTFKNSLDEVPRIAAYIEEIC
ncbi:MAG: SpoIIE family protein phosphatase, partial [Bacteroidaceae bacterium]|nr:SpoIIE family protein phosphatase [Bacteroidaceae bacterium]